MRIFLLVCCISYFRTPDSFCLFLNNYEPIPMKAFMSRGMCSEWKFFECLCISSASILMRLPLPCWTIFHKPLCITRNILRMDIFFSWDVSHSTLSNKIPNRTQKKHIAVRRTVKIVIGNVTVYTSSYVLYFYDFFTRISRPTSNVVQHSISFFICVVRFPSK